MFADVNGFPVESRGWCAGGPSTVAFAAVVFGIHALALMASAFAAYEVKDFPAEFQESRFIALSVGTVTLIYSVAVPTIVAVYSSVIGNFVFISSVIFVSVLALLFFMFFPKMWLQRTGQELWGSATGGGDSSGSGAGTSPVGQQHSPHHHRSKEQPHPFSGGGGGGGGGMESSVRVVASSVKVEQE
jgi:hypothetical protein